MTFSQLNKKMSRLRVKPKIFGLNCECTAYSTIRTYNWPPQTTQVTLLTVISGLLYRHLNSIKCIYISIVSWSTITCGIFYWDVYGRPDSSAIRLSEWFVSASCRSRVNRQCVSNRNQKVWGSTPRLDMFSCSWKNVDSYKVYLRI